MSYNYRYNIEKDIEQYLEDNQWRIDKEKTKEELYEELYDLLWVEDSVTGNGSGSYTFNNEEAKNNVIVNQELLGTAIEEFCIDSETLKNKFFDYEWQDVTIRCFLLGECLWKVLKTS